MFGRVSLSKTLQMHGKRLVMYVISISPTPRALDSTYNINNFILYYYEKVHVNRVGANGKGFCC